MPNTKDKKDIVGPWEDPHKWSKYVEDGTLMDDFQAVDLERKIKEALVAHDELIQADESRRKKLKQERLAAKRATMERLNASRSTTPATRPQSSQIHPMGRVPEVDESASAASPDGRLQDVDSMTFAGESINSIGALTADGSANLDGGPSGTIEGGGSLASGSTYGHKAHGGAPVGPLSIGTGASQQKAYIKGGLPVDEATVQAALDYVGFKEGESDGTLLDGTSVGGGGTVVSALDSVAGTSTMKDDGSTVISTAVKEQEPSALATSDSPSAQTKISKKLRNKLKAKGLSESKGKYSDDDSTVKSSKSSGTTMSLVGSILPSVSAAIPDFGVMRRLGLKRKADDVKSMESSSDKKSKRRRVKGK